MAEIAAVDGSAEEAIGQVGGNGLHGRCAGEEEEVGGVVAHDEDSVGKVVVWPYGYGCSIGGDGKPQGVDAPIAEGVAVGEDGEAVGGKGIGFEALLGHHIAVARERCAVVGFACVTTLDGQFYRVR